MYNVYTMSFVRKIKRSGRIYLAEVESKWVNGRPVQKHLRYIGKEVDGQRILSASISHIEVDSVKVYGPLLVLDRLAREIGLPEILGEYAPELLSIVYAHCVEPRSINQMTDWFAKTDLNYLLKLENVTEDRLLKALDSVETAGRDKLQARIFDSVRNIYKLDTSSMFYDVTNTYLYGNKCVLGKPGHSKHGKRNKPLIQIGLAVTREHGIPAFHTTYEGNTHDARTLHDSAAMFERLAIKDVIVVYDRGCTSKEGISVLKRRNLGSICGLPIKGKMKPMIKRLARQGQFVDIDRRIKLSKTIFYVVDRNHAVGKTRGKLLICYNDKMKHDIRESRYDEIRHAEQQRRAKKAIKPGLEKYFDGRGRVLKARLLAAEEFDGYSCIFSTADLPAEMIVRRYFEKDLVEKAFRGLHGIVSLRPIRHWLFDRVVGHVFVCYLAYLLLTLLNYKLTKAKLEISVVEALKELETLYKVYLRDTHKNFQLDRVVRMNRTQEKIMRAVDKRLLKT